MLLNGPAMYYNNGANIRLDKVPNAKKKFFKKCAECCFCGKNEGEKANVKKAQ